MRTPRLVIIESPFAGEVDQNIEYARKCMLDSLNRGEAPFVSHLLYTQVLDDKKKDQRNKGINAGLAWGLVADLTAVYTDRGISDGMKYGIHIAEKAGRRVQYRQMCEFNPKHFQETDD